MSGRCGNAGLAARAVRRTSHAFSHRLVITSIRHAPTRSTSISTLAIAWHYRLAGIRLRLLMSGNYPWRDEVEIAVESAHPIAHTLALRLPEWCSAPAVSLNGEPVHCESRKGYLHIHRTWRQGDRVKLSLPMQVRRVYGHPQLRNLAGKVAIQRGPLMYCVEEADNGPELHNLWLPAESRFSLVEGTGLFDKILLQADGSRLQHTHSEETALCQYDKVPGQLQPQRLTFIPWFSWANRGEGEMRIWIKER
nr:beta-L-arabinofuranosidase domain-containing protein [Bradyrhizobium sp. Leo121]